MENLLPAAAYAISKRVGPFISSAGMTPKTENVLVAQGRIGLELSVLDGINLAGIAVQRAIASVEQLVNDGESISLWQLTVFVNCDAQFTEHSVVADGATKVLFEKFGHLPSRAAVGVSSLPGNAPVEVVLTVVVS